jgi:uncharacterized protein
MAFYIIHCLDRDCALPTRMATVDAHRAYQASSPIPVLISGPLLAEDQETMIGSFFLVEADTEEQMLAYHHEDPFYLAGIWNDSKINAFFKRIDNRPDTPAA